MDNRTKAERLWPLVLTLVVVAADQITKYIVVKTIPPFTIGSSFFDGILRIVHVSNTGVAFSVGDSLPDTARRFLFAILPLIVIGVVFSVYFRNNTFTKLQRWAICGIVGGGLGNLIDRFARSEGVVDFIDVDIPNIAVPGLFSLERWPTFNIADASIVVCCAVLIVSFMKTAGAENRESQNGR
ncbi:MULTISPECIES: signal peptidase II [Treponema]|uniref:signal peptidase II n=1 Tax=Treponema TaxID=157 RepID=UPI0019613809|nr:signal peptidase II [Treponema sp. Marseille-Q4523]MBM7023016.1 signal peptidase II [Treponema sp. Marseille-Q4523]